MRSPPPAAPPAPQAPQAPLQIAVIGAGPVGLTFALTLSDLLPSAEITLFDKRLQRTSGGGVAWAEGPRRAQVVTLQSRQYQQLPEDARALLVERGQRVWPVGPDSVSDLPPLNLPIRLMEDRLLRLAQRRPQLRWEVGAVTPDLLDSIAPRADIIVAADGAHSVTAAWMAPQLPPPLPHTFLHNGQPLSDHCLGLPVRTRQSSAAAVILTIAQNRYLLNPYHGEGFINIRLAPSEAALLKARPPLALSDLQGTPLWPHITDALSWFNAAPSAGSCALFHLQMAPRVSYVARLKGARAERGPLFGAVLGDAALALHFWPGRGYNCGVAGALSLARTLAAPRGRAWLREADFTHHAGNMAMLTHRHTLRALRALLADHVAGEVPYAALIEGALTQRPRVEDTLSLRARVDNIAQRLTARLSPPPSPQELYTALNSISPRAARVLVESGGWASEVVGGAEVEVSALTPTPAPSGAPSPRSCAALPPPPPPPEAAPTPTGAPPRSRGNATAPSAP